MDSLAPLFGTVIALDDAADYVRQLETALQSLHKTTRTSTWILQKTLSDNYLSLLKSYAEEHEIALDNSGAIRKLLQEVHDYIQELPIMHVTLAFHPRRSFIDDLVQWWRDHSWGPARLAFDVDATIVGGVLLAWDGVLHDYSLLKQMSDEHINNAL